MISGIAWVLTLATWTYYLWRIPREDIARRPWASLATMAAAVGLGIASGSVWGWLAAIVAGYFLFLVLASGYSPPNGLAVGDSLPNFGATSASGTAIRSTDWYGSRVLFKLYRGPW